MIFAIERINKITKDLQKHILSPSERIDDIVFTPCGYNAYDLVNQNADGWAPYALHQNWGGTDQHHWFRAKVTIPDEYAGRRVILHVKTGRTGWDALNPQFLLFINGEISQGLDVNHTEVLIAESAVGDEEYVLDLYAYTGMLDAFTELELQVGVLNSDVEKLYYHLQVPLDITRMWDENDIQRVTILNHLVDAINLLDLRQPGSDAFHASVAAANELLDTEFYGEYCGDDTVNEVCVGHTHIDVAWLWTLAQTREKTVRSFATVIALMKQYPDYIFMSSQAQLYAFVKEDRPDLYEEIKAMIAAGRWEVEGAMWLEADCNLASGESLVRQILHGKRFFKQEFDVENNVLWLPDVFGYSAALPQILRRSGIDYFMTTKISWNEFNKMPYDTFRWKGIDGTDIFTYFISTQDYNPANPKNFTTYNGDTTPTQVLGCWDRYQQKEINTTVLNCFGYGDGGGGPTKPMLERLTRLDKGIPGMPKTRKGRALDFFRDLESRVGDNKRLPEWVGELYLEYHRGTYTSIARNKRYNRKIEFLNREAEWLASMAKLLTGAAYPAAEMDAAWKVTLLNQFHDIIPGSSIRQVYEDSQAQYEELFETVGTLGDDAAGALAAAIGTSEQSVVVFNSLGVTRSDIVSVALPWGWDGAEVYDGDRQLAVQKTGESTLIFHAENVPALGYKSFAVRQASAPVHNTAALPANLENDFFRITLNPDGTIGSLIDKGANREVLLPGARGNLLQAFEDKPFEYDAWNLEIYYQEKMWEVSEVTSIELVENGPVRWAVKVVRPFLNSTIEQLYYLYRDVVRIDFDTTIDWKEHDVVLKAAFPVDVHAEKATYEIQYGNVERPTHWNTSWDWARFEVCAHKWADLSESGYGVSLLNDCKYGHDIRNNTMRLTLLKSATSPNEDADREVHRFVYSLYPHSGGWREGETTVMAYRLNCPLRAVVTGAHEGSLPTEFSYVSADAQNVTVEVVKQAEDSGDTIVRLYEYKNQRAPVMLSFGKPVSAAWEVDLMENEVEAVETLNGSFSFNIKPYEIRSFKVRF